jgi:phosphopantetheinyl transferase (holo-ACP synthase)
MISSFSAWVRTRFDVCPSAATLVAGVFSLKEAKLKAKNPNLTQVIGTQSYAYLCQKNKIK